MHIGPCCQPSMAKLQILGKRRRSTKALLILFVGRAVSATGSAGSLQDILVSHFGWESVWAVRGTQADRTEELKNTIQYWLNTVQ